MRLLVKATLVLTAGLVAGPLFAQSAPSAYTTGLRYDAMHHLTGAIEPDPDGSGSLKYAAVRNTYDANGRLTKVEKGELASWQSEAVAPANWTGFTVLQSINTIYDSYDRKTTEQLRTGSAGTIYSVTQYSYDSSGRLQCTAARMNSAVFGSLPASACTLGTQGADGPDRIAKNVYDADSELIQVRKAVGTSLEQAYATFSYTPNGKQQYVIDANGNRAEFVYDNYDRLQTWIFPSTTRPTSFNPATQSTALSTAGALNTADYEQYAYDANGNRISLRKRDGSTLTYTYDNLNQLAVKTVPSRSGLAATYTRDIYYAYDLQGHETKARFDSIGGEGDTTVFDGFGGITSTSETMDGNTRALSYLYDPDGDRTQLAWPDGTLLMYDYDGLDRVKDEHIQGDVYIVAPAYNNRGLIASDTHYGLAQSQSFSYDSVGRLSGLGVAGGGNAAPAVSWAFTRNASNQILTDARDNDAYAWTGQVNVSRAYTTNGLNEYSAAGSAAFCYDGNGNLTADGSSVYLYDVENRLVEKHVQGTGNSNCAALSYTGAIQASLRYDPAGRLHEVNGYTNGTLTSTTRSLYDGDADVAEYNGGTTLLRRFIHGTDAGDDPLVWYEGTDAGWASARHLYADPRGSIVLVGDASGNAIATNSYDEYGIPGTTNQGRFQYTGQAWLPEIGMYYYKARIYSPTLGRFLQTDPIGYKDQVDLYAYVGDDPVNGTDPSGKQSYLPPGSMPYDITVKSCGADLECIKQVQQTFFDVGITGLTFTVPADSLLTGSIWAVRAVRAELALGKIGNAIAAGGRLVLYSEKAPSLTRAGDFVIDLGKNWTRKANDRVIEAAIRAGRPIADSAVDKSSGELIKARSESILEIERNQIIDAGGKFNKNTGEWQFQQVCTGSRIATWNGC